MDTTGLTGCPNQLFALNVEAHIGIEKENGLLKKMEQKKILAEDEIPTYLEGMGFEADVNKPGLYKKELDVGANGYWDFRKQKKGSFYVADSQDNGGSFWKDEQAKQLPEYIEVRKALGGEEKPKKKDAPIQSNQESHVPEKSSGTLVLRDENQAHDIMNQKDDEQVLAEMEGKYLEEFVYSFPVEGGKRTVTGLSWAGVKEVVRTAGGIEVEDIKITETEKTYRVLAKGRDTVRGVAMFGIAEQAKMMKLKSGDAIEDMHSLSKCVSRAQKNCLRVLIPEATIKMTIEKFLAEKKKRGE